MRGACRGGLLTAAMVLAAGYALGQKQGRELEPDISYGYLTSELDPTKDHLDWFFLGGVRVILGDLELRADSAVVRTDPDDFPTSGTGGGSGLPRRGLTPPPARRLTSEALLRQRLAAFLQAAKGAPQPDIMPAAIPWSLLQSVYLEGQVSISQGGREVLRCDSMHFATADDRTVMRGAELRLWGTNPEGISRVLVVRGDELVKQGKRITGRDVSATACTAGDPHIEAVLGEVEIIERENDFEVRGRSGVLTIGGVGLLPLPNASFFSSDQTNLPIKGASAGYSSKEGVQLEVQLGGSANPLGGALHEYFTGRPAEEFRGDWYSTVGYNESRGVPSEHGLSYGVPGLYRGQFDSFYLHDYGENIREITRELDGTLITKKDRYKISTENRLYLDENTTLDLTLMRLGDAAVYSEFFTGEYRTAERPETTVHLRHGVENRLVTVTGRFNTNEFSYESDRSLADSFSEELPLATFHMFSEPIATLPYDVPVLLTSGGSIGYLRNNFDNTLPEYMQDSFRVDEELEIATPFQLGPIAVRPFATARVTYYGDTVAGDEATRWAFGQGISVGTRLARTWSWTDDQGNQTGLRHVMSPEISFINQYKVDGQPSDFFQFDQVDQLTEGTILRFDLLNRLEHKHESGDIREFVWLDLAQSITPISGRDNNGHQLGLFDYDLILRPIPEWIPIPNLSFRLQGEYDWNNAEERTFSVGTRFGKVLGFNWQTEYSTDANSDGAIGYGASTDLFDRWSISGRSQYDFGLDQTQNYTVGIVRKDHDWQIHLGLVFDEIEGQTSFFINFEPAIQGLVKPRQRNYVSGGGLSETSYAY